LTSVDAGYLCTSPSLCYWRGLRLRRAAALHPCRCAPGSPLGSLGRSISVMPSTSVGSQWCPWLMTAKPCSVGALWTRSARPLPMSSVVRLHSSPRTRVLTLPTKTPAETSMSHRVR